jgi:exodeoxyribonuclease VII large subunit
MQQALFPPPAENIYTVTELTRGIKSLLERNYSSVAVVGEISNFRAHSSGHFYFTLKDAQAQIGAVMFRGSNRLLKFAPEDGLEVMVQGRVSVYEVRGNYQIIVESMEPKGLGALQLAFEQLRNKLEKEGLFAPERKRPLPFLPKTVGIVTSPTGAAIRDIMHVLRRRHPRIHILFSAAVVQGDEAAPDIVRAIQRQNEWGEAEVLIVGRGGGSLEDLWAFNTEKVARAIATSKIPVISAVGHETDVSIADYVADLRAPTPSAAAELAVPVVSELETTLENCLVLLMRRMRRIFETKRQELKYLRSHLKDPKRRLEEMAQRLDDAIMRMTQRMSQIMEENRIHLSHLSEKLQALSPLSILSRGYSIVQKIIKENEPGPIVKDEMAVKAGDALAIRLHRGAIKAIVE